MNNKELKRAIILSFLMAIILWVGHLSPISTLIPSIIHDVCVLLQTPGSIITFLLVGILAPQNAWQSLHMIWPYEYISLVMSALIYGTIYYQAKRLINRRKQN